MEQMSAWGLRISQNFTECRQKTLVSVKKIHVFRKGRHFCEFCENDARFPRVEFVRISSNFIKKSKNLLEFHIISAINAHFCEKDARFQKGPSFLRIL